jgi:hypothetical protein
MSGKKCQSIQCFEVIGVIDSTVPKSINDSATGLLGSPNFSSTKSIFDFGRLRWKLGQQQ